MIEIALTTGEPAGIGPDVTLLALLNAERFEGVRFHVFGDAAMLRERAQALGIGDQWTALLAAQTVCQVAVALQTPCVPGKLEPTNRRGVLATLDEAIDGCIAGRYHALVTAPVQKSVLDDPHEPFSGHTEYLAQRTGAARVVMMLAGPQRARAGDILRVALATTHLPLSAVPAAITQARLLDTLTIIDRDLNRRFGLPAPRILVTGLNPHAGEDGYLGCEEIDVISPAIAAARAAGINATGPYPADTLFQPRLLNGADCVLAMYHDQGLAPLKYATFGEGVNITLGLPIIRTSVDHGTALDLAATGQANPDSMARAIETAIAMVHAERQHAP